MSEAARRRIEIVTDFLDGIGNLDFERVARHLADDAVMALPFLDAMPPTHGRAAIVAQLSNTIPHMFERMDFIHDAWYDVRDSDTLIAEYHSESPLYQKPGMYRNRYITVFAFNGDEITLYKEYLNPVAMLELVPPADAKVEGGRMPPPPTSTG